MPSRLIRSGGRPAISRPAKLTRPLVGAYSPDTTLKSVDLPAPFGPITEKTWPWDTAKRSEEHTSELQSQSNLVCRLLLEKKKKYTNTSTTATRPQYNHCMPDS